MPTHTSAPRRTWNEFSDIPAIHAAGVVSVFFCAAFLRYDWIALVLAAYVFWAVRSLTFKKMTASACFQSFSLEVAAFAFGFCFELCFRAWQPSLHAIPALLKTGAWVLLACVLLSTKFFLIMRMLEASAATPEFVKDLRAPRRLIIAVPLFAAAMFLFAAFLLGPRTMA